MDIYFYNTPVEEVKIFLCRAHLCKIDAALVQITLQWNKYIFHHLVLLLHTLLPSKVCVISNICWKVPLRALQESSSEQKKWWCWTLPFFPSNNCNVLLFCIYLGECSIKTFGNKHFQQKQKRHGTKLVFSAAPD
jgi:hypothetical protein